MATAVYLRDVSKHFTSASGKFFALRDISLDISRGQWLAIVGKSGSGKSTLLNLIAGIDQPDKGEISVENIALGSMSESQLASWRGVHIGIVFQFFQLIPTLSVLENILLAMEFGNVIPRARRTERALGLLTQMGIAAHANKMPAQLSGGEQQRAAIARAMANDPPILIADEPTGNLDSHTTQEIQRVFGELVSMGKTVIVVTHDAVADIGYHRIVRLQDGGIVDDTEARV